MLLKRLLCLLVLFTGFKWAVAQNGTLNVALSKQVLLPGDTLEIDADYVVDSTKLPPYTLQCVVENEAGNTTKLRWPMLHGQTTGLLLITDSLPKGHYKLYFAVQKRFFKLFGKVNEPRKQTMISSSLITSKGDWLMEQLPVSEDGSFMVKSTLFENNATIIFSKADKKGSPFLDVSIASLLDSAFEPAAILAKEIVVGPLADTTIRLGKKMTKQDSAIFAASPSALPNVVVIGKKKTQGEVFNEQYATGVFKDMNERVFSLLDDPSANSGGDIFQYLQGRVAGLQINNPYGGDPTAKMRGDNMYFYLDEIRVEGSNLSSVPISDIAIVKVFPPPFFGNPGGGGGAIGIYTRRGDYVQAGSGKHTFQVKGYSPILIPLMLR